jgi:hypothetical protein
MRVTDLQLWVAVGRELAEIRRRSGHDSTFSLHKELKAKDRAAPAKNTLDAVEKGTASVEKIEAYGRALGYTLVQLITSVLEEEEPLSADARWVGRMFQEGPDEDLRAGMLGSAKAQSRLLAAAREESHEEPPATQAAGSGSRGSGRTARGRR